MNSLRGKEDMDCPKVGCKAKVTRSSLVQDEDLMEQIATFERRKRKAQEEEEEAEKLTQRGRAKKGKVAAVEEEEEEEEM